MRSRHFDGLDALRALAALAIVEFHAVGLYARGSAPTAWTRDWVAQLDVGVPVFFLLSGFLLYRPFVRARLAGEEPSLFAYGWRRFLRIFPGYWAALVVAVLALDLHGVFTPRYLLLAQGYDRATVAGGLPQAWTLTVEVAFYAFLPVWALLVRRVLGAGTLRGELGALAGLIAVSIGWKLVVLQTAAGAHVTATEPWLIALPAVLDLFALGMGAAVMSVRGGLRGQPLIYALAAAALYVLSAKGAGLQDVGVAGFTHTQVLTRHALHGAIALCVLLAGLTGGRVLERRRLRLLGLVSYGIYLYHLTVLGLLGRWHLARLEHTWDPTLLWSVAAVGGAVLCGTVSWLVVERPALSLRRLGGPRLRRSPAAGGPAG